MVAQQVGAQGVHLRQGLARLEQGDDRAAVLRHDRALGREHQPQATGGQLGTGRVGTPGAAHPQVRVQHETAAEPEQVVLAAGLHAVQHVAGQALRDALGAQAGLRGLHAHQRLPGDGPGEHQGGAVAHLPLRHQSPASMPR